MAGRVSLDELRATLIDAENELEDIQLFRPRPDALAAAQRRVDELRAAIAAAHVAQPTAPEPPLAPPAPPQNQPFADALADAWLREDWRAVRKCLARVNHDSVDELRLAIAASGPGRQAKRLRLRLEELEPQPPPPPAPKPVLVVPPQQRPLVDLHDGLVPAERALLLGLQAIKALPGTEPRPLRVVERFLHDELGEDPLLQELPAAIAALSTGAVPLITCTGTADPLLSLTRLATLMVPSGWMTPNQPLPTRAPYFLLRGRLGHCELELPFDSASTLTAAVQLLHRSNTRPSLRNLGGGRAELERSRGEVWSFPTLEIEAGRQDRRARIVVRSIPRPVSWTRALAHLEALHAAGSLPGVTEVQLVSSPKQVSLVADLAHVVYSAATNDRLMHALSACVEVEQLALIDGTPVAVTPDKALDAFLEHRLAVERLANSPQLSQLSQRLELLEGRLVAEALGEALTTVLRHCDAVPTPNLERWALEHFASLTTHPELKHFERESGRWPEALREAHRQLEQRLVNDWRPIVPMRHGFSERQSAALKNGRAALQRDEGLLTTLVATWSELHGEHLAAEREALRQRVRIDLDTIQVTHFGRP